MGLFSSDGKTRAQRRAETKALKAKAKVEAKLAAKDRRKASKELHKSRTKVVEKQLKAQRKTVKAEAKAAQKIAKAEAKTVAAKAKATADAKPFSPASVKRFLTVARLVAPIAVPVIYRAAVAGRGKVTELQAKRIGVSPTQLVKYSGYGAPLLARIEALRTSLQKVSAQDTSSDTKQFVDAMTARLDNLAIAVDAAESMPAPQRKTAHKAVDNELGAIDADVMARLGVRT